MTRRKKKAMIEVRGGIPRLPRVLLTAVFALCVAFSAFARTQDQFGRRDVSGVWWVDAPGADTLLARGEKGDASKCETCHIPEPAEAEPPLTPWATAHLITQKANAMMSRIDNCDPIGLPAQYWFTQLYPFEFIVTPDRIFQFFEKQNEWRVIRMNGAHPRSIRPTSMGDSVGRWEGDTLVIDTVGFDGKDEIEPVGANHGMSPAFRLVERWQRVSATGLQLEATYYDKMAWGSKPWHALKKTFILQPQKKVFESLCSPENNKKFSDQFMNPAVMSKLPPEH
jgi:hypothetical protein